MSQGNILACRIPQMFQSKLTEALGGRYAIDFFEDDSTINAALHRERPLALLADFTEKPCLDSPIRVAHRLYPQLPVILVSPTASSETFVMLQSYGLGAVLPPTEALFPSQIALLFQHYLEPVEDDSIGLERFFPQGHPVASTNLRDPSKREAVLDELKSAFSKSDFVDDYDLQLLLEELVANAALHAFRTLRDQAKYGDIPHGELDKEDHITVQWVSEDPDNDLHYGAISVIDNKGILAPGQVWRRLFRQSSQRGMLDTSGRGLYLAHLLTGLLAITVWPGRCTEVTVFLTPAHANEQRPVSIRVIEPREVLVGS